MPRKKLDGPKYRLTRRRGRATYEITWTDESGRSRYRTTAATDKGQAEEVLTGFIEDLKYAGAPTLARLLDARLEDLKGRGKDTRNIKYFHETAKKLIGHLQPHELTPSRVARYIQDRAPARSACGRELEEVVSACKLGVENGIIEAVPKIKKPQKSPPRERFLTKAEAKRLLDACESDHIRLFILIALTTGARRGAIQGLTWDRVDLERGKIDFQDPNIAISKKRRPVTTIDKRLIAALRLAKDMARTDYVIEYHGKPIKRNLNGGFAMTAERAGLPWCSPHVLKHTAISWLAEADFSVDRIADMTATTPKTVRRIYRKFNPDHLQDAAEALADRLFDGPLLREVK